MPESYESLNRTVRLAIYRTVEATGQAPSAADVARTHNLDVAAVEHAYRALADAHVVVLEPAAAILSVKWYGNRLAPDFRRPTADETRAIFESVGLTGDFWRLSRSG